MKIAGARDELESLFPFHAPPAEPARPSRQAEALLARLKANTGTLEAAGIRFGSSRLALRTEGEDHACRYVGLCLSGCPYSAVWTATQLLESLMKLVELHVPSGAQGRSGGKLRRESAGDLPQPQ